MSEPVPRVGDEVRVAGRCVYYGLVLGTDPLRLCIRLGGPTGDILARVALAHHPTKAELAVLCDSLDRPDSLWTEDDEWDAIDYDLMERLVARESTLSCDTNSGALDGGPDR